MKKNLLMIGCVTAFLCLMIVACTKKKEILDLDKILTIMKTTLNELNTTTPVAQERTGSADDRGGLMPILPEDQKEGFNTKFISAFETNLNKGGLSQNRIGSTMAQDGSIEGYIDVNTNMAQDISEKTAFKIEIDPEGNRLIATDMQTRHRRSSGYSLAQGMFAGYLLRSMFGRQRSMGVSPSKFRNMKMSNKNYMKPRTSARKLGGSRSFRGGK